MTEALDSIQRSRLERLVGRARALLEADLADQAAGRFGIDLDGAIAEEDELHLDPTSLATRRELVDVEVHLKSEGGTGAAAITRLLREAVFTQLNRLIAIRIAEALGLLPPSLADGRRSQGFRDLLELAPLLAGDDTSGYWVYLKLCGDELAGDVPTLFDPRNPLLALAPSRGALDDLIELLADPAAAGLWTAPDCLGWVYQFFNTGEERRAMRDESDAPRNSRELAVRNQFFTPRYVVDFLVQNSLGRRLMDANPTSALIEDLPLLIEPPTEHGEEVDLAEVRVLDPACGSGHFLLAAYDVLERAWHYAGVEAAEAAPSIVRSLWGIEIDPRCTQVAAAALMFRARRSRPEGELPRPNIVCARALPSTSTGLNEVLSVLPENQRRLVQRFADALAEAPILGSLLEIEARLATEVRAAAFGGRADSGSLADAIPNETLQAFEDELLLSLRKVSDATTASPAERLLAAEADDAVRFVLALQSRYDVVLMNPPFGLAVEAAQPYLRDAYPDTWTEMYGAFVERSLDLCSSAGYSAAIVSSQFFATRTMRGFRSKLIRECNPVALVDLGSGVLEGATVNTCMMVVPAAPRRRVTMYADLTGIERPNLSASVLQLRERLVEIDFSLFARIEGNPIAVHMPPAVLERWRSTDRFEPSLAIVRTGNHTFDDFRFLRCKWEVSGADWLPFQKGGNYRPYWASSYLVLDWRLDGAGLKANAMDRVGTTAQVMQSSSLWFASGLTYPHVSSIGFGVRVLPAGEVFSSESISIFPKDYVDPFVVLGLLNSTLSAEILQVFGRNRKFENGAVKALPFGRGDVQAVASIRDRVSELVAIFRELEALDETSAMFVSPFRPGAVTQEEMNAYLATALDAARQEQQAIDDVIAQEFDIRERLDPSTPARHELLQRAFPAAPDASQWLHTVVSYLLGVAFGRWDIRRCGDTLPVRDVFERLAPNPPAALGQDDKRPPDYPIDLPPAGVLVDEQGHEWNVEQRIRSAAAATGFGETLQQEIERLLGPESLQTNLRKRFFRFHVSRYSKSRRKAPIFWPLYVPSAAWGVWVYAPDLSRETLFAIARAAAGRLDRGEAEIRRLQRERETGGTGRSAREVANALEAEERLGEELRRFRLAAERIASLGWEPDLNDGIILCAAPLADLFPAWKDAADARGEIMDGKYPWATVSTWAGEL